jgi:tRNA(His) 5'-end guanylyltransferase
VTKDSLGDRMKRYEHAQWHVLPDRLPVILRVDGRAFHTYTRGCDKPFDLDLIQAMNKVALRLCEEVGGAQLAYVQSDEVSVLVHGYKRHASQAWFRGEVQKIVSIAASVASATMTMKMAARLGAAHFDARVFVLPEHDVCNYFVWRQKDWLRNSVQMLARAHFSQKECQEVHIPELCEMLRTTGHPWEALSNHLRLGRVATRVTEETQLHRNPSAPKVVRSRWEIMEETPVFTERRDVVERLLVLEPEEGGTAIYVAQRLQGLPP